MGGLLSALRGYTAFILAVMLMCVGISSNAFAGEIKTGQITATTTLPKDGRFTLDQLTDGINSDASPYNGFAGNSQSGTITLTFDKAYKITEFMLWNDINVREEGVKAFKLVFYNPDNQQVGVWEHLLVEMGKTDANIYGPTVVDNVARVDMVIESVFTTTGIRRIEIRELEFVGTAMPAPIILPPNHAPIANPDAYSLRINSEQTLKLLANDSDPDGDPISIQDLSVSSPNIQLSKTSATRVQLASKSVPGTFTAAYTITDDKGATAFSTIKITVTLPPTINKPPVIGTDSYTLNNKSETTLQLLANDSDPDGDKLKIIGIGAISQGLTVTILSDTSVRLIADKTTGSKSFTYTVVDTHGNETTGMVAVTVLQQVEWPILPLIAVIALILAGLAFFMLKKRVKNAQNRNLMDTPSGANASPIVTASPINEDEPDPQFLMAQARMKLQFDGELEEENEGIIFPDSPLVATAVAPPGSGLLSLPGSGTLTIPPNQLIPDGLQNLTGDFIHLQKAYHATGRIGFAQKGKPTGKDMAFGTGFLISPKLVMTNRHVYESNKAALTGNSPDIGGIEFIAEKDNGETDFIPFNGEPPVFVKNLDIAIFTLAHASKRPPIKQAAAKETLNGRDVIVIGYPSPHPVTDRVLSVVEKDPIFAVKRVSKGKIFKHSSDEKEPYGIETYVETTISSTGKISAICHNSSTLAGNSGSPVLDAKSGKLLGVHFKGLRFLCAEDNANLAMTIENILKNS